MILRTQLQPRGQINRIGKHTKGGILHEYRSEAEGRWQSRSKRGASG